MSLQLGQEILAALDRQGKLRDVLSLRARVTGSVPPERAVRDRLCRFYQRCGLHDDIPELLALARTVARWENEIIAAVLTGASNARSEALNRIAKLEARQAYGFRNPANQRRRVKIACTRSAAGHPATRHVAARSRSPADNTIPVTVTSKSHLRPVRSLARSVITWHLSLICSRLFRTARGRVVGARQS
jgi:transposase